MAYLVLKGDSYTRKVSCNTANKPRVACKNGNGTSYIPVGVKAGNKNLRLSNSYMDIRQRSNYNTTTTTYTDAVQQIQKTRESQYSYSSYTNSYSISVHTYTTITQDKWLYRYGRITGYISKNGMVYLTYATGWHDTATRYTGSYTEVVPYGGTYSVSSQGTLSWYTSTYVPGGPYGGVNGISGLGTAAVRETRQGSAYAVTTVYQYSTRVSYYYENYATTTGTTINTTTYAYY